jgi:hypothetical protein
VKSAQLYDEYLKTRERPALSLDNYQIHYSLIIERLPIFFPYTPERFNCYKTSFGFRQRTNNLATPPKELQLDEVENIWEEHERSNIENITTHRNTISKTEVYEYSENSRYWKLVDPSIQDPHSIQTYSSDNVFLIVKGENGKWVHIFAKTALPAKNAPPPRQPRRSIHQLLQGTLQWYQEPARIYAKLEAIPAHQD